MAFSWKVCLLTLIFGDDALVLARLMGEQIEIINIVRLAPSPSRGLVMIFSRALHSATPHQYPKSRSHLRRAIVARIVLTRDPPTARNCVAYSLLTPGLIGCISLQESRDRGRSLVVSRKFFRIAYSRWLILRPVRENLPDHRNPLTPGLRKWAVSSAGTWSARSTTC